VTEDAKRLPQGEFLRQRNALWRSLRDLEPDNPKAEVLLLELMRLTRWPRTKILAGLGWNEPESPAG
jgi:hypothetical protein